MFEVAAPQLALLHTPVEIVAAIRRLEELQCPNTAEVVILWAWTVGVVNVADQNAWGSVECETLNFYQTHGVRRINTLSQHIISPRVNLRFLFMDSHHPLSWVGSVQQPVPYKETIHGHQDQGFGNLCVAQTCQLRRLYHLFGYDPTTWKEEVTMEEVNEELAAFSVQSLPPIWSTDWVCDYP